MKVLKKLNVFILSLVICFGMIVLPVQAITDTQDGLDVSFTTDKDSYSENESITANLKVENTNDYAVNGLKLEVEIPEGYQVEKDEDNTLSMESLDASESVSLNVTLVKIESGKKNNGTGKSTGGGKNGKTENQQGTGNTNTSGTEKTSGDSKTLGNGKTSNNSNTSGSTRTSNNAKTGDSNEAVLWVVIMVIATAVVVILVVKGKSKKLFFLFLGMMMLGSLLHTDIKTVNAKENNPEKTSISVTETVKTGEANLDIKGIITYDKPTHDSETGQSATEKYYRENGEIKSIIDVKDATDIPTEKKAISIFEKRGFSEEHVYYDYTLEGEYVEDTEAETSSDEKHPIYYTYYVAASGDIWTIYIINEEVFAYPVSYNLDSNQKSELILSESKTLTSYSDEDNKYYVTVPNESGAILKTIEKIDAETLDGLTTKEIDTL